MDVVLGEHFAILYNFDWKFDSTTIQPNQFEYQMNCLYVYTKSWAEHEFIYKENANSVHMRQIYGNFIRQNNHNW